MSYYNYYDQNTGPHNQYYSPQGIFCKICTCRTSNDLPQEATINTMADSMATIPNNLHRRISREDTPDMMVMLPSLHHR